MNLPSNITKPMLDRRCSLFGALVVLILSSGLAEGKEVTLDIPMTLVRGSFTFGGEAISNSLFDHGRIHLRNPNTGDNVFLGPTWQQQYRVGIIPGEYEIYYEAVDTVVLPENQNLWLGEVVVPHPAGSISRAFVFDIDVPRPRTVSGALTVGGQVPPNSGVEWGRVVLRDHVTGDEVYLGGTSDGEYSSRVAPGGYDIYYRNAESAVGIVPINDNAIIGSLHVPPLRAVVGRTGLNRDIDIPTVSLTGEVLINGVPGPNSPLANGQIFLQDQRTHDKILLTNTFDPDFEATLVPGKYDVLYAVVENANNLVPANGHAQFDRLTLRPELTRLGTITLGVPEPSGFVLACGGLITALRALAAQTRRRTI